MKTPLGHPGPVHRQQILDDAGIRLDHEAKLFVDDPDRHVHIGTVVFPVHMEDGSMLLDTALGQQGIERLGDTEVMGSRKHPVGGCQEHLATCFPGDLHREFVVDAVAEKQQPRGLRFPEYVYGDDRPDPETFRGVDHRYNLIAFQRSFKCRHPFQFSFSRHLLLSRAVQDVPVGIGHDEDPQIHLWIELIHRRRQRPTVALRSAVMEKPVHDVRIVFQDLREARDPVRLRGDDGFDRQVDIPGLVALPLLEHRVENGFVDVVASGEDPAPIKRRSKTMGMAMVFRGESLRILARTSPKIFANRPNPTPRGAN